MPTLSSFFAIYTDGASPDLSFRQPAGTNVFLGEMAELVWPTREDELFGPYSKVIHKYVPKKGFLLGFTKEVKGATGSFFTDVRRVLAQVVEGLDGWVLDVLRLWPCPISSLAEAMPEDFLAEDIFSVAVDDRGQHGFRVETFGLAKLGQRELSFGFVGKELEEEAGLFCGHLAEWILEHGQRVDHASSIAFGFDRVAFFGAGAGPQKTLRGWHPPLIQRLLPESLFEGVGVVEARTTNRAGMATKDMTMALTHSRLQRLVLEDIDLFGDAPHHADTAQLKGAVTELRDLVAVREEPEVAKDSGWRFEPKGGPAGEVKVMSLAEVVDRLPGVLGYLALPAGVRLEWDGAGAVSADTTRVETGDLDDGEDSE